MRRSAYRGAIRERLRERPQRTQDRGFVPADDTSEARRTGGQSTEGSVQHARSYLLLVSAMRGSSPARPPLSAGADTHATFTLIAPGPLSISTPGGPVALGTSQVASASAATTISRPARRRSPSPTSAAARRPGSRSVICDVVHARADEHGDRRPATISYAAGHDHVSRRRVAERLPVQHRSLTGVSPIVNGASTGSGTVSWNPTITVARARQRRSRRRLHRHDHPLGRLNRTANDIVRIRLLALSVLVRIILPVSSALAAGSGSIGIRLVDVPADSRDDPRSLAPTSSTGSLRARASAAASRSSTALARPRTVAVYPAAAALRRGRLRLRRRVTAGNELSQLDRR